jgi:hypothetical protein
MDVLAGLVHTDVVARRPRQKKARLVPGFFISASV